MKNRLLRLIVAVLLAVVLAAATAHAQQPGDTIVQGWFPGYIFENCQVVWWYTECHWVFVYDPTQGTDFTLMYSFCQLLGLCP